MRRSAKRIWTAAVALAAIGGAGAWWMHARQATSSPATVPATSGGLPLEGPPAVRALAGDGRLGARDGAAAQAQFSDPYGLALDPHGALYVSDGGDNDRIRVLRTDGTVATLAGGRSGFQDGQGAAARFDTPSGLARRPAMVRSRWSR